MSWKLTKPGAELRTWVNRHYPGRDKRSDGWIADAAHMAAGTSDHIPNEHGIVHAIDIDADLKPKAKDRTAAHHLAEMIRQQGKRGERPISYVIFAGRIASPRLGWRWRKYTGSNPHLHHIHVSFKETGE